MKIIESLNTLFKDFQRNGSDYMNFIGESISNIQDYSNILINDIPQKLYELLPKETYKIKGSIGQGRLTSCPWVAIMNKTETESTKSGVYVVFLFSRDLKQIYLTLAQGVTNDSMSYVENLRDQIRESLKLENYYLRLINNMKIANPKYNDSAIYANEWNCNDNAFCANLLTESIRAYELYMKLKGVNKLSDKNVVTDGVKFTTKLFSISQLISYINETGLLYDSTLIKRFAFSLMSKRFLILSGLAGSGKTQLALAFASALIEDKKQMCIVSVGADWTNREPLLGFPNALQEGSYVLPEYGTLELLIEAGKPENAHKPFFLILDEMNMSYVERYFADFLSAMESHKPIALWNGSEDSHIPESVSLPKNLFIIGTINVDETTYMFSPKVLDRANVIEFKISEDEMEQFLDEMKPVDCDCINFKAADMGESFVELSTCSELAGDEKMKKTLKSFFINLKSVNAEFGYRSATEIYRFINQAKKNDDSESKLSDNQILDCAMVQKLLPKLHGSRKKLEPVLQALWKECFDSAEDKEKFISKENVLKAKYPLTADKLQRMYEAAYSNGFTSFAEA